MIGSFVEAGYCSVVSESTRDEALSAFALHDCVLSVKAELDQFCEGLQALGVLEVIRKQKELFTVLFIADDKNILTAGKVYNSVIRNNVF